MINLLLFELYTKLITYNIKTKDWSRVEKYLYLKKGLAKKLRV